MLCKLYKNHLQVNAMQNKDQQKKKNIKNNFDRHNIICIIHRYNRICIKHWQAGQGLHKTSKRLYFHCGPSTKAVEM